MTPVLVDSSVLLDLTTKDPTWGAWSRATLTALLDNTTLVINPVIYAEVSIDFGTIEAMEEALPPELFKRESLPYAAGFLACRSYLMYQRRGGTRLSPLPDFYIGAHAAIRGYRLLTRDAARFASYFATVDLIAPDSEAQR